MQWMSTRWDIPENDRTDILAKQGAVNEQAEGYSTYGEIHTVFRQVMKNK